MFYTYVLQSARFSRYYVGSCKDIAKRLKQHNDNLVTSTKHYSPWRLIYTEEFGTRSEALCREKQIKSYKGGMAFKKLLK